MLGDDSELIEGDLCLESAKHLEHPLVADVGKSFIREKLADNTKKPQQWLEEIRLRGSLKNPACSALLAMLQHQGMQPCTAHACMLEQVCIPMTALAAALRCVLYDTPATALDRLAGNRMPPQTDARSASR